jgi:hypothetical protein
LVTRAQVLRNVAAAVALLYLPASAIARFPAARFAIPALVARSQAALALLTLLMLVTAVVWRYAARRLRTLPLLLAAIVIPLHAAEYRTAEVVVIDRDTVQDVYAFARRVEIRARVHGGVYVFAKEIAIAGTVERNVYAMAETLTLIPGGRIRGSLIVAGERARIAGAVGGSLSFYGHYLTVEDTAGVAGPLEAHVENAALVRVPAGMPGAIEAAGTRSLGAILALLAGTMALASAIVFPAAWRRCSIALTRWWSSFALGIAIAVAAAIAVIALALLTNPGVAAVAGGILALAACAAQVLAADLAGRLLLPARSRPLQLICGIALVATATQLPWGIGVAVSSALALAGLGAFARGGWRSARA